MRLVLTLAIALASAGAWAAAPYSDSPTKQWFEGLSSPYTLNCCSQADCKRTEADYHDGAWWALSKRTNKWVQIRPDQVTQDVSIFSDAVLCEGDPASWAPDEARVYCFAPPPIGF